jgi:hypothetical protein
MVQKQFEVRIRMHITITEEISSIYIKYIAHGGGLVPAWGFIPHCCGFESQTGHKHIYYNYAEQPYRLIAHIYTCTPTGTYGDFVGRFTMFFCINIFQIQKRKFMIVTLFQHTALFSIMLVSAGKWLHSY